MRHVLESRHLDQIVNIGIPNPPSVMDIPDEEYQSHRQAWKNSLPEASEDVIHGKVLQNAAHLRHHAKPVTEQRRHSRWIIGLLIVVAFLLLCNLKAHAQFSKIKTIDTNNQGSTLQSHAGPFVINCSTNMTCSDDGFTFTMTASSSAGTAWSSLTAPSGNLALTHGANTSTFTWNAATGAGANLFTLTDTTNNTGTGLMLDVDLASGSAMKAFRAAINGNGVEVSNAGVLAKIGTGHVNADQFNGNSTIAVANGGTSLSTLAVHQLYVGNGTSAPTAIAAGTNGQVLESGGASGDPAFQDPIVSGPDAVAATPTKNPVQVGCLFLTAPATLTNNQVGAAQCDATQNLLVKLNANPTIANTAFTANAGTNLNTSALALDASVSTLDTDVKANITLHAGTNVIGHVIADAGSTTAVTGNVAVTKADGSDVTLGAKADAKSSATDTTAITIMQVMKEISAMEQAPASRAVTNAGTFAVQATLQASSGTDIGKLTANQSVNVAQIAGQTTTTTDNGTQAVAPIVTTSSTAATSACNILSAASTNATNCKGSAGNFYGYEIYNTTTTIYYLRLYNTASAPTCSSATGFIRTIPIQPAGAAGGAGGSISNQVFPVNYGTGIGFCLTGGSSSTDNTNAAVGIFGEIRYK